MWAAASGATAAVTTRLCLTRPHPERGPDSGETGLSHVWELPCVLACRCDDLLEDKLITYVYMCYSTFYSSTF